MVEHTMEVSGWLRKQLEQASPDLLRAMVQVLNLIVNFEEVRSIPFRRAMAGTKDSPRFPMPCPATTAI